MPDFTLSELDSVSSIGSFAIALLTAVVAGALWLMRRKRRNGESPAGHDAGSGRRAPSESSARTVEANEKAPAVSVAPAALAFATAEVLHHHANSDQRRNLADGFDKLVNDGGVTLENLDVPDTTDAAASIADGLLNAGDVAARIVEGS